MSDQTLLDRVLEKVDIIDMVREDVVLRESGDKAKQGFTGKCPFHDDKSPSFSVSGAEGLFYCHGCKVGGNAVNYFERKHGLEFKDALRDLAKKHGLLEDRAMPGPLKSMKYAAERFANQVERHREAFSYLRETRGLSDATIKRFGLGYCFGNEFEKSSPEQVNNAIAAGILRDSERYPGKYYPWMKGKITFPIRDLGGVAVAFGARRLPSDDGKGPKYINTGETAFFSKSNVLYGLFEARAAIKTRHFALLVEGYMDVIGCAQVGVDNVVSVMGSTLSEANFKELFSRTKRLVFCLDPDAAGVKGTFSSIMKGAAFMPDDGRIDVLTLPGKMDPDEYALEQGAEAFYRFIDEKAVPLSKMLCAHVIREENASKALSLEIPEDRSRFLAAMKNAASRFLNAPSIRAEIMRDAEATVSGFLIDAALRKRNIHASAEEITAALEALLFRVDYIEVAGAAAETESAVRPTAPA